MAVAWAQLRLQLRPFSCTLTTMLTTFSDVPVKHFLDKEPRERPEMVLTRGLRDHWVVLDGGLVAPKEPQLIHVNTGELVRVPLTPYLVSVRPERLFPFAVELGIRALAACPADVVHLHLAIGTPAQETSYEGDTVWRQFIGIAFKLKG